MPPPGWTPISLDRMLLAWAVAEPNEWGAGRPDALVRKVHAGAALAASEEAEAVRWASCWPSRERDRDPTGAPRPVVRSRRPSRRTWPRRSPCSLEGAALDHPHARPRSSPDRGRVRTAHRHARILRWGPDTGPLHEPPPDPAVHRRARPLADWRRKPPRRRHLESVSAGRCSVPGEVPRDPRRPPACVYVGGLRELITMVATFTSHAPCRPSLVAC
jgi:hypothetical protein